jgi:NAD-reducing hydrogenase large subunit
MAVRIPPAAQLLRELIHCAQFVQSHALSFFHLSAPDLLLGMDSDPATPQRARPDRGQSRAGARRHRAAQVRPAGDRRAGRGACASLLDRARRREVAADGAGARPHPGRQFRRPWPSTAARSAFFKGVLDSFTEEIANFGSAPTMYAGLVDATGNMQLYDGKLRFRDAEGGIRARGIPPRTTHRSSAKPP